MHYVLGWLGCLGWLDLAWLGLACWGAAHGISAELS